MLDPLKFWNDEEEEGGRGGGGGSIAPLPYLIGVSIDRSSIYLLTYLLTYLLGFPSIFFALLMLQVRGSLG